VLFSAAHYVGPCGDPFRWLTFLFRFLAGVFFAVLFRYRGFGIAAGTHALYDVLVGLSTIAGPAG
jgi:membrane protease YdiL (CAAX protease family)